MRRVIITLIVVFIGSFITLAQPSATISLPYLEHLPSGNVYSPIIVEDLSGRENFGSFQLLIVYDPAVITPINVKFSNPDLPFYEWSNNLGYGPNRIILTWSSFTGGIFLSPGNELCQIEWKYKDTTAYSFINFVTVIHRSDGTKIKDKSSIWTSSEILYNTTFKNGSIGKK